MYTIQIQPFDELTVTAYHRIVQAREQVFHLEQHITSLDADQTDPKSIFLWIEDGGQVVAFLRIIPRDVVYSEISIGRVLVDIRYRRQGICRTIMLRAIQYITEQWGTQPIRISAQSHLTDFYHSLGFNKVSEEYIEAGIPHFKMLRD